MQGCDEGLRLMNELMDQRSGRGGACTHIFGERGERFDYGYGQRASRVSRSPKVRADLPIPDVTTLERKFAVPDLRKSGATSTLSCCMGAISISRRFRETIAERDAKQ